MTESDQENTVEEIEIDELEISGSQENANLPLKTVPISIVKTFYLDSVESLRTLLSSEAVTVIPFYQKYGKFNQKTRSLLCRTILTNLLKNNLDKSFSRREFEFIADLISKLFEGEDPKSYFIYKSATFQGTLPNIYNKLRKSFAQVDLIQLNKKRRIEEEDPSQEQDLEDDSTEAEGFIQEAVNFLESNNNDIAKIKSYWRLSHKWRAQELKKLSVAEIFTKFPCLQTLIAHELAEIDTLILFPKCKRIENWDLYYEKVLEMSRQSTNLKIKSIVARIDSSQNENDRKSLIFTLLPYLLSATKTKIDRKTGESIPGFSKFEVQQAFIDFAEDIVTADQLQKTFVENYRSLDLSIQPRVILVGETNIISSVYIGENSFLFQNPLEGIQAIFDFHNSLNIDYSFATQQVWGLIGQLVFEIGVSKQLNPTTRAVLADLKK